MNKIALITGATAGIGKAVAIKLAENGFDVIITGRRALRLIELEKEIISKYNVKALALNFDIRKKEEVFNAIDNLPKEWTDIKILVNNAGLALGMGTLDKGNIDDWEQMIDTNIKGLLYISKKISPGMIEKREGHIINIGSIAGREVYPSGNVYCLTKHAVDAITKAMRLDFVEYGIKVTQIAPGMANTEFSQVRYKGDKEKANKVYEGFTPLYAEDIAEAVLFAVTRPKHVNINDMLIMATAQASANKTYKF